MYEIFSKSTIQIISGITLMLIPGATASAFKDAITPDPRWTVTEWADEHRVLSTENSAEGGKYRSDRTPYMKKIMDALSPDSPYWKIVFMKSARIGGSEAGNNAIGRWIHSSPAPIMHVMPTVDAAKSWSVEQITPMVNTCPVLHRLVGDNKSRDGNNTIFKKGFPGGFLILNGANSAAGFRFRTIKYLVLSEVDSYPADLGGEGCPVQLAVTRTNTYKLTRKIYIESTPTVKNHSHVEREVEKTPYEKYYVPCPECGARQVLTLEHFIIPNDDPTRAHFSCKYNGCKIEERHKSSMLRNGEWRATQAKVRFLADTEVNTNRYKAGDLEVMPIKQAEELIGEERAVEVKWDVAGFHISAFYSPLGWLGWDDIAREYINAKGDMTKEKSFRNLILGETYEEEMEAAHPEEIFQRRVKITCEVPKDIGALFAGVDTQDDRLEATVWGFGLKNLAQPIDRWIIKGDPDLPDTWKKLDRKLKRTYQHESGNQLKILATCIDSGGHKTDAVYRYVKNKRSRNIFAIKGVGGAGFPTAVRAKSKYHKRRNTDLYRVGVDSLKNRLLEWLNNSNPEIPGHIRLPEAGWCDMEFVNQLCAEKKVTKLVNGNPVIKWEIYPAGQRNEQTDIFVYANAAMYLYHQNSQKMVAEQLAWLNDEEVEMWGEDFKPVNNKESIKENASLDEFEAEMEDNFYEVDAL